MQFGRGGLVVLLGRAVGVSETPSSSSLPLLNLFRFMRSIARKLMRSWLLRP